MGLSVCQSTVEYIHGAVHGGHVTGARGLVSCIYTKVPKQFQEQSRKGPFIRRAAEHACEGWGGEADEGE